MGTADLLRWHRQNMSVCQVVSPPPHIYCKKAGTDMVCSLQSSWAEVPEQDDSDRRDEAGDRLHHSFRSNYSPCDVVC